MTYILPVAVVKRIECLEWDHLKSVGLKIRRYRFNGYLGNVTRNEYN